PRSGSGADSPDPSHQCRRRPERGGPGAAVSAVCDARSTVAGTCRNGRGTWLVHRSISPVRVPARGLRRPLCREARAAARNPRARAGPLVGQVPPGAHGTGRLPETAPESLTDLAGCRRDPTVLRTRGRARPAVDGGD